MSATEQQLLKDMNLTFENLKVTLADLRNPTEEFVGNFLCYYLSEFEVDPNNVQQIHFAQTVGISSYQDAFTGILPKLNLMKAIKELNVISDFGLSDIINPSPKRTQYVIRALLNFYQWADFTVASLIEKRDEMGYPARKKSLAELLSTRDRLKETLNNVSKEMGQLQIEKSKYKEECDKTKEKFDKIRLSKEVAKKETEELGSKYTEKENCLHKLDKEIVQVRNKTKECSNQIIDSPTVMLGDLKSLREKEKELIKCRDEKRDTVEAKMKTLKTVRQGLEDQQQRTEKLMGLLKLIDQSKEALKELTKTEKSVAIQEDSLNELKNILTKLEKKKKEKNYSFEKLIQKEEELIHELKQHLEDAKSKYEEKKMNRKNLQERLKNEGAIQEKIDAALDELKDIVKNFTIEYSQAVMMVDEAHQERMLAYKAEEEHIEDLKR